jgi:transcriptional regulator with XRE-family HTH domain
MSDNEIERRLAGIRLQEVRKRARLTIRDVARATGLDKNTIMAIEQGRRTRLQSRNKLYAYYGVLPVGPPIQAFQATPFAVQAPGDSKWVRLRLTDGSYSSVIIEDKPIGSSERHWMGLHGLASQYMRRLNCDRAGGRFKAAIFEVYASSGWSSQSSGEAFVFALRGSFLFRIGSDQFELHEGCAATFDRTVPHMHEPLYPISESSPPPVLLYVQAD